MAKPKIGLFSFTSCEGCSLIVLSLDEKLLELVGVVDVVNYREASSLKSDDYEIAFIEGAISTPSDIQGVKRIRKQAKVCIALGSCAHVAGVNQIKNFHNQFDVRRKTYGDKAYLFDSILAQPIDSVIKVDYVIPGCPIDRQEFLQVVTSLLLGKKPFIPDYPVCVQCKMKGNVCVFQKASPIACLGPVTRAGCGAVCPSAGNACEGCRGLIPDPNLDSHAQVLRDAGLSTEETLKFYRMYNGLMEVGK